MKLRFFLSIFAFAIGLAIVGTSVITTEAVVAGENNMSSKKLYVGRVLPDHVAYPLLMAMDRFYLETSSETERIYKQIDYANRRLFYAKELLSQDDIEKQPLALSTLTKAEKYLIHAVTEYQQLEEPNEAAHEAVLQALEYHHKALEKLVHEFSSDQRPILDELQKQEEALLEQLQTK